MTRTKSLTTRTQLHCADAVLNGQLRLPAHAAATILIADASGTETEMAGRARTLETLHDAGLGTLEIALLGPEEQMATSSDGHFQIALLSARLRAAVNWLRRHIRSERWPVGCLCTGASVAAMLLAAAEQPGEISSLVVCGGRPDLAGPALRFVSAPTLMIAGSEDPVGLAAHQLAFDQLAGPKSLEIVLGSGAALDDHLALGLIAESAAGWLAEHLSPVEAR